MNIGNISSSQKNVGITKMVPTNHSESSEKINNKDTAVVVRLSKEGLLKNQNHKGDLAEVNNITSTEINQGEIILKRSLKSIIEDVRNGKELSKEEQEQLNQELEEMVNGQYMEMKNKKLSPEDERVLKELKNSYMMKQRSLQDLKKNLEEEKLNAELEEDSIEQTQKMEDVEEKQDLVESLFEDIDDDKNMLVEDDEDKTKEGEVADSVNVELDKENAKKADNDVAGIKVRSEQLKANEENFEQINGAKRKAILDEKFYANQLKEEHRIAIDTIKDEKMSNLEKVNRYEHFMEISEDLMVSREIAKHVKIYNHHAAVDLKMAIRSNGSVSLAEFMLGKKPKAQAGRDFINKM